MQETSYLLTTSFDSNNEKDFYMIDNKIYYKITHRSCLLYLSSHFPHLTFTKDQINKCFIIFDLISKRSNFYEIESDGIHIGYEQYFSNETFLSQFREDGNKDEFSINFLKDLESTLKTFNDNNHNQTEQDNVKKLLFNESLHIICTEVNQAIAENDAFTIDTILTNDDIFFRCFKFWYIIVDKYETIKKSMNSK